MKKIPFKNWKEKFIKITKIGNGGLKSIIIQLENVNRKSIRKLKWKIQFENGNENSIWKRK